MITPLDFYENCLCGSEKMKKIRIYNMHVTVYHSSAAESLARVAYTRV